jgi:hypothetical protein
VLNEYVKGTSLMKNWIIRPTVLLETGTLPSASGLREPSLLLTATDPFSLSQSLGSRHIKCTKYWTCASWARKSKLSATTMAHGKVDVPWQPLLGQSILPWDKRRVHGTHKKLSFAFGPLWLACAVCMDFMDLYGPVWTRDLVVDLLLALVDYVMIMVIFQLPVMIMVIFEFSVMIMNYL